MQVREGSMRQSMQQLPETLADADEETSSGSPPPSRKRPRRGAKRSATTRSRKVTYLLRVPWQHILVTARIWLAQVPDGVCFPESGSDLY